MRIRAFTAVSMQTFVTLCKLHICTTNYHTIAHSFLVISSTNKVMSTTPNPESDTIELENEPLPTQI